MENTEFKALGDISWKTDEEIIIFRNFAITLCRLDTIGIQKIFPRVAPEAEGS